MTAILVYLTTVSSTPVHYFCQPNCVRICSILNVYNTCVVEISYIELRVSQLLVDSCMVHASIVVHIWCMLYFRATSKVISLIAV